MSTELVPNGIDCWEWTGHVMPNGYGQVRIDRKTQLVHRVVWEALVGPIPAGMHIDHWCRNRRCANPDHLQVVTQAENNRRAHAPNRNKVRCKRGHLFTEENTVRVPNGRQCRACKVIRRREYHERTGR